MTTKAQLEQELALYREMFDTMAEIIDDDELPSSEQFERISAMVMAEQFNRDDESEES